ncbi:MAG: hypothetical protein GFH27_549303n144 [Chloroflexi bacterium AL-W]|nr:hypothetical protein [Chloroflexi bacterium AL-N1]NOK68029.1 hypothetical protein [Chloroflexi bacterium AL-N10]NOK73369.1 hypothetical protein [Chloroflexi bacterium AL-N5]NOK83283.1 hypothetical protein [Chloroflexi bacterium AL-W]NOK87700.1 hypothetical protein [Chloroflexi bacterium AL-N15]
MFKVLWLAIKDLFDELFVLMGVNIVWILINLPLFGLTFIFANPDTLFLASITLLLSILTLGPTNAGLYIVAERVTEGRKIGVGTFFEGLRSHVRLSWQVYGTWMFGLLLILVNLQFYAGMGNVLGAFLLVLFLYILLIWFGILIYIGPLMIIQVDKRLRMIARNALLMTLGRPLFTIGTLIVMGLISVVSFIVGILVLLVTFSFFALWGFHATNKLIKDAEDRRAKMEEKTQQKATAAGNPYSTEKGRGGQIRPRD